MGRKPGTKLSQEQKDKMQQGRKNRKLGIVKEKPIKVVSTKKKGRPKGTIRTKEEIEKATETRKRNKIEKELFLQHRMDKPILKINKNWETGFDFWPAMRNILRPLHRYDECQKIEKTIVNNDIWQNKEEIIKILSKTFIIDNKKVKDSI